MSIAAIVTRGYGSFGSIADIARAGYGAEQGAGEPVVPPPPVTSVGDGDFESWEDYVKAEHRRKHLKVELQQQEKQLKKVEKQIKAAEKKVAVKRTEGILANLQRLEFKKLEIENKIQAIEVQMIPLEMFLQAEIDDDDEEVLTIFN